MKCAKNTSQKRRGDAGRPAVSMASGIIIAALLAMSLLVLIAVSVACSEATKYRVLSFFFDGVPNPQSDDKVADGRTDDGNTPGQASKPVFLSSHRPYKDRKCFQCHDTSISMQAGTFSSDTCRKCHKGLFDAQDSDWVHGPMAAGDCSFCHKGHQSQHMALLTASQPDLCLKCHDAALLKQPYHQQADKQRCSTCHDPHFSGNRLLLADSRTYARSVIAKSAPKFKHAPWKDRKCALCHVVKQSYRLIDDIDSACVSCHQKVIDQAAKAGHHAPVRQGKCSSCHESHESVRPHLVRGDAQSFCYTCHKPQDLQSQNHPKLDRVDCFICHAGHTSGRDHLLKPAITATNAPEPAASTQPQSAAAGIHTTDSAGKGANQ